MSIAAADLNHSPIKCGSAPMPAEEKFTLPGLALA